MHELGSVPVLMLIVVILL